MIAWLIVVAVIFTLINLACMDEAGAILRDTIKIVHGLAAVVAFFMLMIGFDFDVLAICEIGALIGSVAWFNLVGLFWWIGEKAEALSEPRTETKTERRTKQPQARRQAEPEIVYGEVVDEYPPLYECNPQYVRLLDASNSHFSKEDDEAWERLRKNGEVE